jgi:hypothetical protein
VAIIPKLTLTTFMCIRPPVRRSLVVGLSICAATGLSAQSSDRDKPVQLIGLHTWTRQMVKDSLAKKVPGSDTTLSTHACGAEMLQLGFVRTAAIYYPTRIIVSVVEPQDSALVRTNPAILTTKPLPDGWQAVLQQHLDMEGQFKNGLFTFGVEYYTLFVAGKGDSVRAAITEGGMTIPPALDSLWTFLAAHGTDADRIRALDILEHDSAATHRTMAIGVLTNFPHRDDVWRALLHVLRDRNDVPGVWLTAKKVLARWVGMEPRKVDWAPSTDDLRAFFAGANLWALPDIMRILTVTQVDPTLAPAILAHNDVFVLGYAESGDAQAAKIGQDFLTQMSGREYGADMSKWRAWSSALRADTTSNASRSVLPGDKLDVSNNANQLLEGIEFTEAQRVAVDKANKAFWTLAMRLLSEGDFDRDALRAGARHRQTVLRTLLTPAQRTIFDKNVEALAGGGAP